jgi:hypothetical protein
MHALSLFFFLSSFKTFSKTIDILKRILNTIGNVPLEWYDDFDHIGYDLEGNKIMKPKSGSDKIDEFVSKNEDPTAWYALSSFSLFKHFLIHYTNHSYK